MDVDSDQSVTDGIARINKDHGPVDVLVNNAGVERGGVRGRTAAVGFSGQSWKPTTSERSAAFRPRRPPCGNGERVHYQCDIGCGRISSAPYGAQHVLKVGAGSL